VAELNLAQNSIVQVVEKSKPVWLPSVIYAYWEEVPTNLAQVVLPANGVEDVSSVGGLAEPVKLLPLVE
jgi:hypothetical protein